jgi:hypothetical protein
VPIIFNDRVRGVSKMSWHIIGEAISLVTWWGLRDRVLRRGGPGATRPATAPAVETVTLTTPEATVTASQLAGGVADNDVETASS